MAQNLFYQTGIPLAIAVALVTTGITLSQPGPLSGITVKNFSFTPAALDVKAGTSVKWTNRDSEPHTVTSADGLFRSGALDQDDGFTVKFDKPGTYTYLCSIHPQMRAAIIVH